MRTLRSSYCSLLRSAWFPVERCGVRVDHFVLRCSKAWNSILSSRFKKKKAQLDCLALLLQVLRRQEESVAAQPMLRRAVRTLLRGVMHVERWVRACVRNGCIIDRLSLPAFAKCFILIVARCARVQACCGCCHALRAPCYAVSCTLSVGCAHV